MRTVEVTAGTGDVLLGGHPVARVEYRLQREQGMFLSETFGGSIPIPGFRSMTGTVTVVSGTIQPDEPLMLQLDDGRALEFVARDGNYYKRSYRVVPAGEIRAARHKGL
jgi:hypothetical protein